MTSALPLGIALLSLGCSVAAEDYAADEAQGSTHAALRVAQVESVDGTTRGDAMVGFLQIAPDADREQVLSLAGLQGSMPAPGECTTGPREAQWIGTGSGELLEASEVLLSTQAGSQRLAPHAFPAIFDLLRGVVYTTRDNDGQALPESSEYAVTGESVLLSENARATLVARFDSPSYPRQVSINGADLSPNTELSPSGVLDVAWSPGTEGDTILVSLEGEGAQLVCSFADKEGYGSVPLPNELSGLREEAEPLFSIHRIRRLSAAGSDGLSSQRVEFDFAREGRLSFVSREATTEEELVEFVVDDESAGDESSDADVADAR